MTSKNIYMSFGGLDPELIAKAAPAEKVEKKKKNTWVKWGALAACLCLVIGIAFRVAIGFIPNQATDIFREGTLIEITSESDLPAQYDGKLLAFNLEFPQYEFYYRQDCSDDSSGSVGNIGSAENTENWYSLLASKHDSKGKILLHCMFGDSTVDDWKVSTVFTKNVTETITVSGIEVQIARLDLSLQYEYWYYAIFEYDDVVYDIRVQSNNAEYVYDVLETLINA